MPPSTDPTATATGPAEAPASLARFIPPDTRSWPAHWQRPTTTDLEYLEARYRRGFAPPHAAVLRRSAPALPPGSAAAKEVSEQLFRAVRGELKAGERRTVGLAAPQVGLSARAILFDPREAVTADDPPVEELRCVINPAVQPLGDLRVREVEGCLSVGRICGWVCRADRVRLLGFTPTGSPIDEEHTGHAARVLQHEADHISGIRFPQRIGEDSDLLWASIEQLEQFAEYARAVRRGEDSSWSFLTPRDQWEAIQGGLAVFGRLEQADDATTDSASLWHAPAVEEW